MQLDVRLSGTAEMSFSEFFNFKEQLIYKDVIKLTSPTGGEPSKPVFACPAKGHSFFRSFLKCQIKFEATRLGAVPRVINCKAKVAREVFVVIDPNKPQWEPGDADIWEYSTGNQNSPNPTKLPWLEDTEIAIEFLQLQNAKISSVEFSIEQYLIPH